MGVRQELADTLGCQSMRCRKALCSKGFRALGCRRIIYLYIFYYIRKYIYRKKYAGYHSADTQARPRAEDANADTTKKRLSFSRKKSQKAIQKAEERKSGFGFFSVFSSILHPLRLAGLDRCTKRKPATAGGSFCYRSHHRRAVGVWFFHHCTRSAILAGCVSGIAIRSQPFGVR